MIQKVFNKIFRTKGLKIKKQDDYDLDVDKSIIEDKRLKREFLSVSAYEYEFINIARRDVKGKVLDRYPINDPWAHTLIVEDEGTGEIVYVVDEVPLQELEKKIFARIINYIMWSAGEITPETDPIDYITRKARQAIDLFRLRLGSTPTVSWSKILYYVERDILGYDVLDPLMKDPYIEDISCNGVGYPIYVWHRKYESIPTNIWFRSHDDLDRFVLKLAHKSGKHISVAYPILDAMLPEGHRVAATFMKEVSTHGSTFTIRKFREDPITIIDLINFKTISPLLAGYLWFLIDRKSPIMVLGVTGAGKTTLINSILNLVKPTYKVVTIEDTPELRLPIENWVQLVSRPSYAAGESKAGEVSLYDLIRVSLRYRPDIIAVGEIRGEEAYVLFQAIATGHGGVTTIHAEDIDSMIKRLKSPPMNIPESYIPLINSVLAIKRVSVREGDKLRIARRVTDVWELDKTGEFIKVSWWSPSKDMFVTELDKSILIKRFSQLEERSYDDLIREINERTLIMYWLSKKGIRNYREIARYISMYHVHKEMLISIVKRDLKIIGIDTEEIKNIL
ncbi:MAG: type II/IV secretion system ATPase subunit [Desulfurococcaceae archaeon]|nr:type II/IV secretion system ATPase subunit [Desulfurococcaceae archaeon]